MGLEVKIVLGVVNEGHRIAGMSILSLWTNFHSLKNEVAQDLPLYELNLRIVSKNSNSDFSSFAKRMDPDLQIIEPTDWETTKFPPMSNGSYATYWKIDLINATQEDELLIYIDADAFIISKFHLKSLLSRINELIPQKGGCLFMVPAHRPVYERMGYNYNANPYQYFNAGVFLCINLGLIKMDQLHRAVNSFFSGNYTELSWHDQDLLNSLFSHKVFALPLKYNVSTGVFNKENFGRAGLNYLAEKEIVDAIIVHASGGILYKSIHYAFKETIWLLSRSMLRDKILSKHDFEVIEDFSQSLYVNPLQKQLRYLKSYSPRQRIKLIRSLDSHFFVFRIITKLLNFIRIIRTAK